MAGDYHVAPINSYVSGDYHVVSEPAVPAALTDYHVVSEPVVAADQYVSHSAAVLPAAAPAPVEQYVSHSAAALPANAAVVEEYVSHSGAALPVSAAAVHLTSSRPLEPVPAVPRLHQSVQEVLPAVEVVGEPVAAAVLPVVDQLPTLQVTEHLAPAVHAAAVPTEV